MLLAVSEVVEISTDGCYSDAKGLIDFSPFPLLHVMNSVSARSVRRRQV